VLATANNTPRFEKARCPKVLICDPRDTTILDPIALRTTLATNAVRRGPDRFLVLPGTDCVEFLKAWERLVDAVQRHRELEETRAADAVARSPRDGDSRPLVTGLSAGGESPPPLDGAKPLSIGATNDIAPPSVSRLMLDILGCVGRLNAAGTTLQSIVRGPLGPEREMNIFFANMQVWGSRSQNDVQLAGAWKQANGESDLLELAPRDIGEYALHQASQSLARVLAVTEDRIAQLENLLERGSVNAVEATQMVEDCRRVQGLVQHMATHFASKPKPHMLAHDPEETGFLMNCACGHNGGLNDEEMAQLELHIYASGVGTRPPPKVPTTPKSRMTLGATYADGAAHKSGRQQRNDGSPDRGGQVESYQLELPNGSTHQIFHARQQSDKKRVVSQAVKKSDGDEFLAVSP